MTASTPASPVLKHAPLTAEMVPLLTAGKSIWRDPKWGLVRLDHFDDSKRRAFTIGLEDDQVRILVPKGDYLGEDMGDGRVAAPPSGWTCNPVPGRLVDVEWSEGISYNDPSEEWDWTGGEVIAFRLADKEDRPPVEGAGTEGADYEAAWLKAEGLLSEISAAIGSTRFMDPPDGGDLSLAEQVRRMRHALEAAENALRQRDGALRRIRRESEDCIGLRMEGHNGHLRRHPLPERNPMTAESPMVLVGQINALLAIQNPYRPVPGLARELLERAAKALSASPVRGEEPFAWAWRKKDGSSPWVATISLEGPTDAFEVVPLYAHPPVQSPGEQSELPTADTGEGR